MTLVAVLFHNIYIYLYFFKDGVTLPEKVNAVIQIIFMNRDSEFFPDPDSFKPERFSTERSNDTLNPYTYVPFSAGCRLCKFPS